MNTLLMLASSTSGAFDTPLKIAGFTIGLIGSILICLYTLPQLWYIFKTKDTTGIKLAMYAILCAGCLFFVCDGVCIVAGGSLDAGLPLIIANFVTGVSATIILTYKIQNISRAKKLNISEADYVKKIQEKK